jgi:hypothetical protein
MERLEARGGDGLPPCPPVSPQRTRLAALAGAAVLAAPATAIAQGAVDEQYRDPFAGGEGDSGAEQQPEGQDGAPSADTQTSAPAPVPAPTGETATAGTAVELPRTGPAAFGVAFAGAVLMAAGLALRRRSR